MNQLHFTVSIFSVTQCGRFMLVSCLCSEILIPVGRKTHLLLIVAGHRPRKIVSHPQIPGFCFSLQPVAFYLGVS